MCFICVKQQQITGECLIALTATNVSFHALKHDSKAIFFVDVPRIVVSDI